MVGNDFKPVYEVGMNEHACSSSPKAARKILVEIWEELETAFGAPIWLSFMERGELMWKEGVPYRVYKQRINHE